MKKNVPVFVTLGIGGEPLAPKLLYVLYLGEIQSNII